MNRVSKQSAVGLGLMLLMVAWQDDARAHPATTADSHYQSGIPDVANCLRRVTQVPSSQVTNEDMNNVPVKNSWGSVWSRHGLMQIVRGTNVCGLEPQGIHVK